MAHSSVRLLIPKETMERFKLRKISNLLKSFVSIFFAMALALLLAYFFLHSLWHQTSLKRWAYVWSLSSKPFPTQFMQTLRVRIAEKKMMASQSDPLWQLFLKSSFPKQFHGAILTLEQKPLERILVAQRSNQPFEDAKSVLNKVIHQPQLGAYRIMDSKTCTLRLDIILEPLRIFSWNNDGLLLGEEGLRLADGKNVAYFLPSDTKLYEIKDKNDLKLHIARLYPDVPFERIQMRRFRTLAYQDP